MRISLIACINNVHALGKDNGLLYHIPSDLANFKRMTIGKVIVMGKNTFESLPIKPLPDRKTIIICDEEDYAPQCNGNSDDVLIVDSIESAISVAETMDIEEIVVCGGASIYAQFIERGLVDTMYLTVVDDETEGDVTFPEIDENMWVVRYNSDTMQTGKGKLKIQYRFVIYQKK